MREIVSTTACGMKETRDSSKKQENFTGLLLSAASNTAHPP